MLCNISVDEFFALSVDDILESEQSNSCWPWTNLNSDDWLNTTSSLRQTNIFNQLTQLLLLIIIPFGIFGSICAIATVWRKSVNRKKSFYIWMLIIAILDLFFNILYIPSVLSFGYLFQNVFIYSYAGTEIASIFYGPIYFFSLTSDLCALGLTLERFVAICKPTTATGPYRKLLRVIGGFVIVSIGLIRCIRYGAESEAIVDPLNNTDQLTFTLVSTDFSQTQLFFGLAFVSDIISPFILLILMIYFSARLAITMILRRRKQIGDASKWAIPKDKASYVRTAAMLRLLFILVGLFIFNQLGYCFYAIGYILNEKYKVTFDSSCEEMIIFIHTLHWMNAANFISSVLECLTRSLTFYLYFSFSTSIRAEFKRGLRKITSYFK